MTSNRNRTAIVTGGTKGVGRAIAQRLGQSGMNLVIGYSSDEDAARATSDELAGSGGDILTLRTDIRNRAEVEALFKLALDRFGRIDVVVANAGVEIIDRTFADLEEEGMDRVVDINVKGTFFTLQQAARHVADGGQIIVTSSTIALNPPEKAGLYASTKAAVRLMVEGLSKELGRRGVTVNSIAPGMVKSAGVFTEIGSEIESQAVAATPLGRMVEPADIGGTALFLVSADAAMISGQHLGITGGATI